MTPHMDAVIVGLLIVVLLIWGCAGLWNWINSETETENWRGE